MSVASRPDVLDFVNRLRVQVVHFAYGTFPEAHGFPAVLSCNRFFIPETSGSSRCFIADDVHDFEVKPGCAYFIPAYHEARVKLDEDLRFVSIQFRLEMHFGVDFFSYTKNIQELQKPSFLKRAKAAFQMSDPAASSVRLRTLIMDFCGTVMKNINPNELNFAVRFSNYQYILEYLEQNMRADTTVEKLAELQGLRRETFSRNFTADTGITPKEFLSQQLFNRATALLMETSLSIKEIASELGFSSEYYFSSFFHRRAGIPPGIYRRHNL